MVDAERNLRREKAPDSIILSPVEGCYDFVGLHGTTEDRDYYDGHYHHHASSNRRWSVSPERLERLWNEHSTFRLLYDSVGDVQGKDVLLLGNGDSLKELRFALDGARLVYTDVSIQAVLSAKRAFERLTAGQDGDGIEFHAVDALHLPFADESFDVIYGCAFVHHLHDLHPLFTEVSRCLKDGGRCVFLDDAYSPLWQLAKATVLRPLQAFVHWKTGISPEDRFATRRGGYRREELETFLTDHEFHALSYERSGFLEHLIRRGFKKLVTENAGRPFIPAGRWLDRHVLGRRWIERHGFLLVWGYSKDGPMLRQRAHGPPPLPVVHHE